jgi:predicted DNA-binding transcriptional regulator AlpA
MSKLLEAPKAAPEHWTIEQVCDFFGGNDRPLNPSTIYRGIKDGRFPAPVKVGPQTSRWLSTECEAARARMMMTRDTDLDASSQRRRQARAKVARKQAA